MDNYSNNIQGIRENYNATKSNKSLKQKLFTAYLNEHLICNSNYDNKTPQKEAINTFDNTDLFYLLSLAEKLPAYGVGFSDDSIHDSH
ncbi:MAG TPA: hypothetical protein PK275_06125 [Chitinophagaceae bacterium]|jgi:hypothetical protein|nr:hypothetical protein [Chitinophagaceae bacterium]